MTALAALALCGVAAVPAAAQAARATSAVHAPREAVAPVDSAATPATSALLSRLRSRAGAAKGRLLIGQEIPTFAHGRSRWYRDFARLHKRKLRTPIIMGGEVDTLRDDANDPALNGMIAHARAGGILELDWHPNDPVDDSYPGTPLDADQLAQLTEPGTDSYSAWHADLDGAATVLARFADAGVPVIFRPMVEMNGVDFFWWSDDGSTGAAHDARVQAFVGVWRDMVSYLTVTKGLHNLLFTYSPNADNCDCAVPAMTYYPGSAYVDVMGIDVYNNSLSIPSSTYRAMVATGKPFGFAEFGQGSNASDTGTGTQGTHWDLRTLTRRATSSYPAMAFAIAWYSSYGSNGKLAYVFGLSDVAHVPAVLANPLVTTLPVSAP